MKEKETREVFVSGYGLTNDKGASIALYAMTNQLEFGMEVWKDTILAPSFLCTYKDQCFAIREEGHSGSVLCYQRIEGKYILRDELILEGGALCHIVYQPITQTLYCSFYETGHVAAVKVEDYHFVKVLNFFQMKAQDGEGLTRAHCCALEPDGTSVLITNIALDRIYIYESNAGVLSPNTFCEFVQLEKGIGPRHIKFHPLQRYLYLITEYSNEVLVFLFDHYKGEPSLKLLQQITTLPPDFTGISNGSSLDISKDGRFLYAANRGADTVAVYEINSAGTLCNIQNTSCGGKCPRHIALTKDDAGLMIANQKSDEVVVLRVNGDNGMLSDVVSRIPFAQPSFMEEI